MLGGDIDCAVGVDCYVHGFADRRGRAGAQFAVAHAIGKEDGHCAGTAIGNIDRGAGIDGEIYRLNIATIVLERETRLAAGREFVDETGGSVSDIDDGLAIAGHGHWLGELAGTFTVGTPSIDILERWRRSLLCGNGLRGTRAAEKQYRRKQDTEQVSGPSHPHEA